MHPEETIHYFPGGVAFFSSFGAFGRFFGAFFSWNSFTKIPHDQVYHNEIDDDDLPITAILIPY